MHNIARSQVVCRLYMKKKEKKIEQKPFDEKKANGKKKPK